MKGFKYGIIGIVLLVLASFIWLFRGDGEASQEVLENKSSKNVQILNKTEKDRALTSKNVYFSYNDAMDRTLEFSKVPKRVVILSSSLVDLVEMLDVPVVGKITSSCHKSKKEDSVGLGMSAGIDIERVLAMQPDCVFLLEAQNSKFIPIFETNNINCVVLKSKTYKDVLHNLDVLGKIFKEETKCDFFKDRLMSQMNSVLNKVDKKRLKVAVLHASSSKVLLELDETIAGDCVNLLGWENVGNKANNILKDNKTRVPYSLEQLVLDDPDVIFITTMGDAKKIEKRLKKDFKTNPSWAHLRAVEENHVYSLPVEYFLLTPNLRYPRAVEIMLEKVYPKENNTL